MAYFDKYGVEFSDDRKTLIRCPKDFNGEYIIPNSVTMIAEEAFQECSSLSSIIISSSISIIEKRAFILCISLSYITTIH